MKFINPKGQLIATSVTLKKLFGEYRRCLEVTLNGQEILLVDDRGNTVIPSSAKKFNCDVSTFERVCDAIDRFLMKSNERRSRVKTLSLT